MILTSSENIIALGEQGSGDLCEVTRRVLAVPNFQLFPASLDDKHHHWPGGLCDHTSEVITLMLNSNVTLGEPCDYVELFLSGLFHDLGKVHDYMAIQNDGLLSWSATPHKKLIHHITQSAIMFTRMIADLPDLHKYEARVIHNILSHHGHPQYGSPVQPQTKAAWMLHLCDGLSARMEDGDRIIRK